MRVQFISDLHLERYRHKPFPRLRPTAPYLFLLGDIGDPYHNNYREFMCYVSNNWERIYYVSGNHEYTSGLCQGEKLSLINITETNHLIDMIIRLKAPNIYHLNKNWQWCEKFKVFGCTFWSEKHYHYHTQDKQWLQDQLPISRVPTLVLTHYPPTNIIHTHKNVQGWFCGHSHVPTEHGVLYTKPPVYLNAKPEYLRSEVIEAVEVNIPLV